jgi:hypothetical protein
MQLLGAANQVWIATNVVADTDREDRRMMRVSQPMLQTKLQTTRAQQRGGQNENLADMVMIRSARMIERIAIL